MYLTVLWLFSQPPSLGLSWEERALLLLGGMGGWESTGRAGWERRKARTGRRRGTKRGEISRGGIQWGEAKEEMHLSRHGPTVTLLGLGMGLGTPNL